MGSNGGDPADQSCRASSVLLLRMPQQCEAPSAAGLDPPQTDVERLMLSPDNALTGSNQAALGMVIGRSFKPPRDCSAPQTKLLVHNWNEPGLCGRAAMWSENRELKQQPEYSRSFLINLANELSSNRASSVLTLHSLSTQLYNAGSAARL
jgi:hypothetical protein